MRRWMRTTRKSSVRRRATLFQEEALLPPGWTTRRVGPRPSSMAVMGSATPSRVARSSDMAELVTEGGGWPVAEESEGLGEPRVEDAVEVIVGGGVGVALEADVDGGRRGVEDVVDADGELHAAAREGAEEVDLAPGGDVARGGAAVAVVVQTLEEAADEGEVEAGGEAGGVLPGGG